MICIHDDVGGVGISMLNKQTQGQKRWEMHCSQLDRKRLSGESGGKSESFSRLLKQAT
jgi:hypothetical protein